MLEPQQPKTIVQQHPPAEEKALTAEQLRIRTLEKQNHFLRKHLDEKDRAIKELNNRMTAERRRYLLEVTRDREIRSRDQYIMSLQSSIFVLRRQIRELERLKELLKQLSSGEIAAVGVFPQVSEGLTLIRRKLKPHDIPALRGVKVAFTKESANFSMLAECGVLAAGTDYVWEVAGSYFILAADLTQLKPKAVSLDRLIEEYRSSRTT
jgi:predicted RNase H-like nuclease (RuvC/YqgF family)